MARSEPDSSAAFEALFQAHYAPLCDFVSRYVKSRDIAHELVQDLFVRLWELSDASRAPTLTAAYLYTAARNRALKYLRHQRVVERWEERAAQEVEPTVAGADEDLCYEEMVEAVDRAIAQLPECCRLVFVMSRDRKLSYAEIADVLGISAKTVEGQMVRALRVLRMRLAPHLLPALAAVIGAAASI